MKRSTAQRVQSDLTTVSTGQRRHGAPPMPNDVSPDGPDLVTAPLAEGYGAQPGHADIIVARDPRLIPSQRSRLPSTVRRAPQLWSILYDGLSASDQRWVLDTIDRYREA